MKINYYESPEIEVVNIEVEGTILSGSAEDPDFGGII